MLPLLIPLIAAGISAAGGIAQSAMQKKPPDPMNPIQAGPTESAPISGGGGGMVNPLQKQNPANQRYEAVGQLLQNGYGN